MRDSGEFMTALKVDLYPEEVYTFTPRGKVIVLPREASPIDFAYAIHSDVGHRCTGAKVNGRIVPLKYALRNGDVVEIVTQTNHQPSKDWLAIVKTSRARNKIRHVINTSERAKAIEIGEKYLAREARRLGVSLLKISTAQIEQVASDYGLSKLEDLHAALGYGKFSARQVLQKLAPSQVGPEGPRPEAPQPESVVARTGGAVLDNQDLVIQVKGMDDLLTYRAKCCNPIRGEPIVGYVTRGKGVAVHSVNCTNVQNLMYDTERKIDVEWARSASQAFPVHILVHAEDRPGILNQVTTVLFNEQSNIRSLEARGGDTGDGAAIEVTLEVKDKKQLERVVASVRRIPGVRDVERTNERS
jgi:GTP diphosphokinase / guanosine-3',5'-bis(diphosphate) 3'-diphosphatase